MSDILKIKFYIHNSYSDEEELDSFEINISKYEKFGDLLQKITEERFVERGVISLMFKNEMVFFDGSPEIPGFKNMFEGSDVLTEFLESEKSDDGTLELIYKEKEAASGAFEKTREISSSDNVQIVIPLTNFFEGAVHLDKGAKGKFLFSRKRIFSSTLLLKVVTHIEEIDGKKIYQCKQYEIPKENFSGYDQSKAPIFIEVLGNNQFVVNVGGKPITKKPLDGVIAIQPTEIQKKFYDKYVEPFLASCTVVGTIAAILAIPGVL